MKENVSDCFQMARPKIKGTHTHARMHARTHTCTHTENKSKHGERLMTEFG